jgi:Putative metallopeptidase
MPRPRRLRPWLASLLGLGWLLGLALPGVHAGAFRVAETRPRDPRAAALWQHPQVAQALRVWTAVATEIFRLPTDVTITPAPCGRIDGFYDPVQQQLHLCEELLTYYAGVLTPPGGDPRTPAPVVRDATLVSLLHLLGHALLAVLDLPVTDDVEEAADAVGVAFLAAGSPEDERTVLAGSAALVQRSRTPEPPHLVPWWAHHPWTDARATHLRCLLAGSHPPSEAPGLTDPPTPSCRDAWQRWQTRLTPSLRLTPEGPATAAPPPSPPPPLPSRPLPPPVPDAAPLSPVASLRAYYEALNARQYAQTWLLLAPVFKQTHFCCEPDGSLQFGRYRAWWEQVARVEVLDAHVQERQPAEVVVQATVRYVMRRGTVTEEQHQFRLVAEPATQRWLIAAQTRGVQRPRAR